MAFTKSFKITKEPRTFQAGESTGFQLSLGSQYYDRKTKKKEWSNYKAVVFAKGNQLSFYQSSLVVGTIVELSADDLKIDNYNPEYLSIELIDAKITQVFSFGLTQQSAAPQQAAPAKKAPVFNEPPMNFDEDLPFAPIGLEHSNGFIHCI